MLEFSKYIMELLLWDIYEIQSQSSLHGVMLRGRLRKFANQQSINLLTENEENGASVRFAVLAESDPAIVTTFITSLVPDAHIERVREKVSNPVLSKLQVNVDDRYTI